MSDGCSAAAQAVVNIPNELPAMVMPSYTNAQIEEYLKNMEEANEEVFKLWQQFTERWEARDAEYDNDFVDWLSKRADKLINLREVLLLKSMASFETAAAEEESTAGSASLEAADKFEDDFKAVTFINKIIYCIARVHNEKEAQAVKEYKERLEKEKAERPVENANFE